MKCERLLGLEDNRVTLIFGVERGGLFGRQKVSGGRTAAATAGEKKKKKRARGVGIEEATRPSHADTSELNNETKQP